MDWHMYALGVVLAIALFYTVLIEPIRMNRAAEMLGNPQEDQDLHQAIADALRIDDAPEEVKAERSRRAAELLVKYRLPDPWYVKVMHWLASLPNKLRRASSKG